MINFEEIRDTSLSPLGSSKTKHLSTITKTGSKTTQTKRRGDFPPSFFFAL